MKEIILSSENNLPAIYFNYLDSWDGFEEILVMLKVHFDAKITDRVDGPESKFVNLTIDKSELILINNPYGNTLKSFNDNSKAALMKIYANWSNHVKL